MYNLKNEQNQKISLKYCSKHVQTQTRFVTNKFWFYIEKVEKNSKKFGKNVEKFSYCPLHLIVVFQPKGKKEDLTGEDEIPQFIEKKIKT